MSTAQEQFDREYITSSEIYKELGVTRPALHFRRKAKKLPEAIVLPGGQLLLWHRAEIQPFLEEWKAHLKSKQGTLV